MDDDHGFLNICRENFKLDYPAATLLTAKNVVEAKRLIDAHRENIDVVILDYHLVCISEFQRLSAKAQRKNSGTAIVDHIKKLGLSMPIFMHTMGSEETRKRIQQENGDRVKLLERRLLGSEIISYLQSTIFTTNKAGTSLQSKPRVFPEDDSGGGAGGTNTGHKN